MVVSRVFQTFLRDFVFSIRGPIAAHRVRPGRNDDARLSAVARQKIRGSRQGAKNAKTPLVFLAFPAPWRDTIFPALNDPHLLSESELIVWKARTHFLQEIFCSASNRVARRGDTKAQFANQTGSRGVEQFDSPDLHLSGSRTRSVAPAYRLFDPGYCRSLDLSMTYKFCDRN